MSRMEAAAERVMGLEDRQEVVEGRQRHLVSTKDSKGALDLAIVSSSQSRTSPALLLLLSAAPLCGAAMVPPALPGWVRATDK